MGEGADAAEAMAMESGAAVPEAAAAEAARSGEQAGIGPEAAILGSVAWLMARSPMHRHAFLADLEWRVLPAIALGQCRLAQQDGKPVAFISWATVSDEVEARLAAGGRRVFVDVIAPFGGGRGGGAGARGAGEGVWAMKMKYNGLNRTLKARSR